VWKSIQRPPEVKRSSGREATYEGDQDDDDAA
jgi:hypothetical protein